MKIIYRGAESIIYLDEFKGEEVIVKERIKKNYRIDQIDKELRKARTRKEVKLLTEARKASVPTPQILYVSDFDHKMMMENVTGQRLKELLYKADKKAVTKTCLEIGKLIGKLHSAGIIHGDLTTSNIILKDKQIYFIDFGLGFFSKKTEDQGTDLNLLYEALKSTHFKILKLCWNNILKGYKQEYRDAEKVLKRIEDIEKRARYAKR